MSSVLYRIYRCNRVPEFSGDLANIYGGVAAGRKALGLPATLWTADEAVMVSPARRLSGLLPGTGRSACGKVGNVGEHGGTMGNVPSCSIGAKVAWCSELVEGTRIWHADLSLRTLGGSKAVSSLGPPGKRSSVEHPPPLRENLQTGNTVGCVLASFE